MARDLSIRFLLVVTAAGGCSTTHARDDAGTGWPDAADQMTDTGDGGSPFGGCGAKTFDGTDPFADCVEAFAPAGEASFGHADLPDIVLGPPRGAGPNQGSTDVASLGCGGSIILYFADPGIVDGEGPDFIVFENPFFPFGSDETWAEPARVSASDDAEHWWSFPCEPGQPWPPEGCAGVMPVMSSPENGIDPTDPASAGGDAFDLAEVGLVWAQWLLIEDVTAEYAELDSPACVGSKAGFDLDAVATVHAGP